MKSMKRGLSLHIGINTVDDQSYGVTRYARMSSCVNDAEAMRKIAAVRGFQLLGLLCDCHATLGAVEHYIRMAAGTLRSGETFLLTFSGHGARISTGNRSEGYFDEGMVLYDLIMKDDYIDVLLRRFSPGVRVIMVFDSCYSHTMYHFMPYPERVGDDDPLHAKKKLARTVSEEHGLIREEIYRKMDQRFTEEDARIPDSILADVVILSACDDNELAAAGPDYSVFTKCMIQTLRGARRPWEIPFMGSYRELKSQIHCHAPNGQNPQITLLGPNAGNEYYPFFQGPPFTLIQ